jgi:NADPH:quinone reductase-like Zn-dependent oxidoreductase
MKALRFDRTGSLDALHLIDAPVPEPAGGEVLVRVTAAGLNPSDVKNVLGRFPYTVVPRTPGRDFAGVVERGPAALVGREVWGTGNELGFVRDGTHAQYLTLPGDGVATRPRALTAAQAAACGVPYTTALDALVRTGVAGGTRVVIVGVGAVGSAAIDIALWLGARVVAAVRRPEQATALGARGIGAILLGEDKVGSMLTNPRAPENASREPQIVSMPPNPGPTGLGEAVRAHFGDDAAGPAPTRSNPGADVIFDTTGQWLEPSVHALARHGQIAVIAPPPGDHANLPVLALYRKGSSIVGVNSLLHDSRACATMLARLTQAFDAGRLPPPAAPTEVSLDSAVVAYREVDAGRTDKVVFTPVEEGAAVA